MEAAVDDKGDAMHDPGLLQHHQQQDQGEHVGDDNARQADEAIQDGPGQDPGEAGRLPGLRPGDEAGDGEAIEKGADLEDEEQHQGEDRQGTGEAPPGMEEEIVRPALPAGGLVPQPGAQHRLVEQGGAVMAIGVDLLRQGPRQGGIGGAPHRPQSLPEFGKMGLELAAEIGVLFRQLQAEKGRGDGEGRRHLRVGDQGGDRRQGFGEMAGDRRRGLGALAGDPRLGLGTLGGDPRRGLGAMAGDPCRGLGMLGVRRLGHRPCRGAAVFSRHPGQGGEEIGQPQAHVRHGRHHRPAQAPFQGAQVDEAPPGPGLVQAVEGEDHGAAELQQLQGQLQIPLQVGGIQHQQQDIRGGEVGLRQMGLVAGDGRPAITPEQIFERHPGVRVPGVQAIDGRQGDQGDLVQAHLHQAVLVGGADSGQAFVAGGGAGGGAEDALPAAAVPAEDRHPWASGATQAGAMQGEGRYGHGGYNSSCPAILGARRPISSLQQFSKISGD